MSATAAAAISSFTSQPIAWEVAMGGLTFVKSELTTISGTAAMSHTATASSPAAKNERRWSHAQVKAKAMQVRKGSGMAQMMAFVSFFPETRHISGCRSYRL